MEEHAAAPDTHVVVEEKAWDRLEEIKRTIKRVLEEVHHHSLDARVPSVRIKRIRTSASTAMDAIEESRRQHDASNAADIPHLHQEKQ
jgi:hypothetical protein